MPSPFPGMDPYLEQHWGDVHHNLISFAEGWLNERLPRDLVNLQFLKAEECVPWPRLLSHHSRQEARPWNTYGDDSQKSACEPA